jgi:transposase InsO family protein
MKSFTTKEYHMSQVYHSNAKTNQHSRAIIQKSQLKTSELAKQVGVSSKTIRKWKTRDFTDDKSSKPHNIKYALTPIEKEVIKYIRTTTWMSLDDLTDTVATGIPRSNRSSVRRALVEFEINRVPKEKRAEAKKFKEYEPGYLHMDVTYMPKLEGIKHYLFVAIDRATRLMYYRVYENKSADNATAFLQECKAFFPFHITHMLTDNGLEFTDKWIRGKGVVSGNHQFDQECTKEGIEHRLTAPNTPATNGMVERANGTIKNATIKAEEYQDIKALRESLNKFLIYYIFTRGHSGLRRELKVRTPYEALEAWFVTKPELFKISPHEFRAKAMARLE